MKRAKHFLFVVLWVHSLVLSGQIQSVQYWVDDNYSARRTLDYSNIPNAVVELHELSGLGNIASGMHTLHIRAKDEQHGWSVVSSHMFMKLPVAPNLALEAYEYWIDDNFDIRTTVPVSGTSAVIASLPITADCPSGMHTLHIRAKDEHHGWGVVSSHMFMKLPVAPNLALEAYEYWIDDNFDTRTTVPVSGTSAVIASLPITADCPSGMHTLHIRAKDKRHGWGVVSSHMFMKLPVAPNLALEAYEYWIDDNFDTRTTVPVSGTSAAIASLPITADCPSGMHTLHIRAKDEHHGWGVVSSHTFFALQRSHDNKVDSYRYWFDNDFDNHHTVALPEPLDTLKLTEHLSLPATFEVGERHAVHFQFKDVAGMWTTASTDSFTVVSPLSDEEFDALTGFYVATGGTGWHNSVAQDSVWNIADRHSTPDWKGVGFAGGHVRSLILTKNNLTGTVPEASIAGLQHLEMLYLDSNHIEGLGLALPDIVDVNLQAQGFVLGEVLVTEGEGLSLSLYNISRYNHEQGDFDADYAFDIYINDTYKTNIASSAGKVAVAPEYLQDVEEGDVLRLVQDGGAAKGTEYSYRIMLPQTGVGVHDSEHIDVRIYPNPVTTGFYLQGVDDRTSLTITASDGRVVLTHTIDNTRYVPMHGFPSGIYVVTLQTTSTPIRIKVIKQ